MFLVSEKTEETMTLTILPSQVLVIPCFMLQFTILTTKGQTTIINNSLVEFIWYDCRQMVEHNNHIGYRVIQYNFAEQKH